MICFALSSTIYAAEYEQSIILLDIKNDRYISLIGDAAHYLKIILNTTFTVDKEGVYSSADKLIDKEQLNHWVREFKGQDFIAVSSSTLFKTIAPGPLIPGGLKEYKWDIKSEWKPFAKASFSDVMYSYFTLIQVYRRMKKKKMAGLFELIKENALSTYSKPYNQEDIDKLTAAVDAATLLYPQKTYCLVWATTFTLMALKKGWPCQLVIGIQTAPFYAHAWASIKERVIGDDPQVAHVLAALCKQPERYL